MTDPSKIAEGTTEAQRIVDRIEALENLVGLLALEIAEVNPVAAPRLHGIAQLIAEIQENWARAVAAELEGGA